LLKSGQGKFGNGLAFQCEKGIAKARFFKAVFAVPFAVRLWAGCWGTALILE